jgi:hypothetical protein
MQQQRLELQQHLQQPDCPQHALTEAGLRLTNTANLSGLLLELLVTVHLEYRKYQQVPNPKGPFAVISSIEFMAGAATGIAAIWRSEAVLQEWRTRTGGTAKNALARIVFGSSLGAASGRVRTVLTACTQAGVSDLLDQWWPWLAVCTWLKGWPTC